MPTNFANHQHQRPSADDSDDSDSPGRSIPSLEAAPVLEGNSTASGREANGGISGQRRNTLGRRHSPSVASSDRPQLKHQILDEPELSLAELNERFEDIRKETDETLAQYAKDEADSQRQEDELREDREKKRQAVREKDEQTAQLKASGRSTMEQMRAAEKERNKMLHQLREKEARKTKVRENITSLGTEGEKMKGDRQKFNKQKQELSKKRDAGIKALNKANTEMQKKCSELEAELRDKGKQLQDLKATRSKLPGADDEEWKEDDAKLNQEWELKRKDIHTRLVSELKQAHQLDQQLRIAEEEIFFLQQQPNAAFFANQNSNTDLDSSAQDASRRHSVNSLPIPTVNLPSPTPVVPIEPNYPTPPPFSIAPFAPGLFTNTMDDMDETHSEAELRMANGPLSPGAQILLPSNIFDDLDDGDLDDGDLRDDEYHSILQGTGNDPQSPASSSRSMNVFSSPHGSSHNLPFPQHADIHERHSLSLHHPQSNTSPVASHKFTNLLSTFQRSRGAKSSLDQGGPPIGSLKSGQSQSFPLVTEEPEAVENKRKLNFPWMSRASAGPDTGMHSSSLFSSRRPNPLRNSSGPAFPDGDHDNSRPASIASSDLPRPSTDSGSIWATPGEAPLPKNRFWPGDGRWPSRNGSRRPSLHGSTSALTTTLASADDEILDEMDLLNPQTSPSQVGVIGSRLPASAASINQRLNPTAPTFMATIFRKDRDRDKDGSAEKDKSKGKDKERGGKDKAKIGVDTSTPSIEFTASLDDSPSDSRMSRDTYSVYTQNSVSESHESFNLDPAMSNTPSDMHSNAGSTSKDQENVVRKLFRKGSSSKFSLSSRLGKDSGIFKKGPGSTSNSDKNMSADQRSSIGDVDDLGDDSTQFGRSYDSMASTPSLLSSKSKDNRESRMSSWRFSMRKKGREGFSKDKESLEIDRPTDEE